MQTSNKHIPVLANELIEAIQIKKEMIIVDCTLGRGGHAKIILEQLDDKSHYIAFDQDSTAIEYCKKHLAQFKNKTLIQDNFENLSEYIEKPVDAIIMDIGVSSPQLDNPDRGFSYQQCGPLDMRMNKDQSLNAKKIVNEYSEDELINIFYKYGEEKYSKSIARKIIQKREEAVIETTYQLVDIIKEATPAVYKKTKHPAKKVFQALRIEVNNELRILSKTLEQAIKILKPNGTLAVITFHSLEDKIVKKFFAKITTPTKTPTEIPIIDVDDTKYFLPYKKPIKANQTELKENRRSKSATLRVVRKKG